MYTESAHFKPLYNKFCLECSVPSVYSINFKRKKKKKKQDTKLGPRDQRYDAKLREETHTKNAAIAASKRETSQWRRG